jgi:hypothetical protein
MNDSKKISDGRKKSLANLKPAKKGEPSRNPKGRPKLGLCLTDKLRDIGEEINETTKRTHYEDLANMIWARARSGDVQFVNIIYDRTEGKAIDRVLTQQTDDDLIIL